MTIQFEMPENPNLSVKLSKGNESITIKTKGRGMVFSFDEVEFLLDSLTELMDRVHGVTDF
jgi:hypothetical protein